ncbi:hypothetical protein NL676_029045 [Syzygium grande]|nr:hypothetical protein NL676_029045 [Syzygium grande]
MDFNREWKSSQLTPSSSLPHPIPQHYPFGSSSKIEALFGLEQIDEAFRSKKRFNCSVVRTAVNSIRDSRKCGSSSVGYLLAYTM